MNLKINCIELSAVVCLFSISIGTKVTAQDELRVTPKSQCQGSIINNTDWFDVEGRPIMAHEGDIARFNGFFYWYGSSYENNPNGKFDIGDGPVRNGVQVYRSTDLKNWTYKIIIPI